MRKHPGASVATLAKVVGANRSTTGERLRSLAKKGKIEKSPTGSWRLKGEEPRSVTPGEAARPTEASPAS
jgi:DNA-binding IclR family transcriptional regulator